jgi:hypothetical protein
MRYALRIRPQGVLFHHKEVDALFSYNQISAEQAMSFQLPGKAPTLSPAARGGQEGKKRRHCYLGQEDAAPGSCSLSLRPCAIRKSGQVWSLKRITPPCWEKKGSLQHDVSLVRWCAEQRLSTRLPLTGEPTRTGPQVFFVRNDCCSIQLKFLQESDSDKIGGNHCAHPGDRQKYGHVLLLV